MKIVVGLGNPGEKYISNRHNAGVMFVLWLQSKIAVESQQEEQVFKKDSTNSFFFVKNDALLLAYPNNFMNLSGIAVGKLVKQYGANLPNDLHVAHDDLDISLGKFKIEIGRGPKLHNGLSSIEDHLHTKDFYRIRIGVDARDPENRLNGEAYVLQDFTTTELEVLKGVFAEIFPKLDLYHPQVTT